MLGVMLAWKAPPLIISRETMHNVWGMIEWILNTFIFLLAGLIIGDRVLEKVKLEDVGYLFVLYLLLMLVRCFVIALLFPLLSSMGHRCTRNEAIFMSWAGLRGVSYYSMMVMVMYSDHL
jgi:NhaP-type Na+/H+ or K+/H+ antiporter